jgi:hypothetical protein
VYSADDAEHEWTLRSGVGTWPWLTAAVAAVALAGTLAASGLLRRTQRPQDAPVPAPA